MWDPQQGGIGGWSVGGLFSLYNTLRCASLGVLLGNDLPSERERERVCVCVFLVKFNLILLGCGTVLTAKNCLNTWSCGVCT